MSPHVMLAPLSPTWQWGSKWIYFTTLALALGSVLTHVLVVRPSFAHDGGEAEERGTTTMYRVMSTGAALLVVGALTSAISGTARARKISFGSAASPGTLWGYLTAAPKSGDWFSAGQVTLTAIILVLLAAVLLVPLAAREPNPASERLVRVALVALLAVLVIKALPTGPGSADLDGVTEPALTQLHILGSSVWAGGLVALLALTRSSRHVREASPAAWLSAWRRFGTLAMVSVAALTLSGVFLLIRGVGSVSQMFTTTYGLILSAKLVLVALLLGAGAYNQLVLMPRLVHAREQGDTQTGWRVGVRHFGGVVLAETVAITIVILAASMLSGSARKQAGAPEAGPVTVQLLIYGIGLLALIVAALWATAKASERIASRPQAGGATRVEASRSKATTRV